MKMNWGFKIVLAYGAFVVGIMFMVYMSSQQNRDLVSENYYADELAYQKVIDQSSKTAALTSKIEVYTSENAIQIVFPKAFENMKLQGSWILYYAANQAKDLKGNFKTTSSKCSIDLPENAKGNYKLKINWNVKDEEYYFEKSIFIQ